MRHDSESSSEERSPQLSDLEKKFGPFYADVKAITDVVNPPSTSDSDDCVFNTPLDRFRYTTNFVF